MSSAPLKIIVIGNAGVGKSHLVDRLLGRSDFDHLLPTTSVDCGETTLSLPSGRNIKVQLWDTGKFRSISCKKSANPSRK